jgi:hypothetical protein
MAGADEDKSIDYSGRSCLLSNVTPRVSMSESHTLTSHKPSVTRRVQTRHRSRLCQRKPNHIQDGVSVSLSSSILALISL